MFIALLLIMLLMKKIELLHYSVAVGAAASVVEG